MKKTIALLLFSLFAVIGVVNATSHYETDSKIEKVKPQDGNDKVFTKADFIFDTNSFVLLVENSRATRFHLADKPVLPSETEAIRLVEIRRKVPWKMSSSINNNYVSTAGSENAVNFQVAHPERICGPLESTK